MYAGTTNISRRKRTIWHDKVFECCGKLTAAEQELVRAKLSWPMVACLVEQAGQVPILLVSHRHRIGGGEEQPLHGRGCVIYQPTVRKTIELRDIETVGSPDSYQLRLTTYNETFVFDLKSPLDSKVCDSLWKKSIESRAGARL